MAYSKTTWVNDHAPALNAANLNHLESGVEAAAADADAAVKSVIEGTGISVDATDPEHPVVSATGTGTGDVVGPASATDGRPALFDGTTGKLIKVGAALGTAAAVDTGTASGNVPLLSTGGRLPIARIASGTPDGTKFVRDDGTLVAPGGSGDVVGPASSVAHRIAAFSTTTGKALEDSGNLTSDFATAAQGAKADAALPKSTVTTKGDILAATASATVARLGVGSNGQVLTADSTQTSGVKWATPSGSAPGSWANQVSQNGSAGLFTVQSRISAAGDTVEMRGGFTTTAQINANTSVFSLPSGHRPAAGRGGLLVNDSSGTVYPVAIATDGEVLPKVALPVSITYYVDLIGFSL